MVIEVKIEKNIPVPAAKNNKYGQPLMSLEVDESFAIDNTETNSLRNAIQYLRYKFSGKRFATRLIDGGSKRRVWRIE